MIDSFSSAEVSQPGQDIFFSVFLSENVSDHDGLSRLEVPYVDVVDIDDALYCLELCLEGIEIDVVRH